MSTAERPLASVPPWIVVLLGTALLLQLWWAALWRTEPLGAHDLPPAPAARALQLASLGEPAVLARLAMVWLLAFDARGDNTVRYQQLDYARLIAWLRGILELDARNGLPLFAAARIYAENADPLRMRAVLEFIFEEFPRDPNRRWPELAHAALLAKHRLHDLPLARRYAAALQRLVTDDSVPLWAKQMEVFILEDMNELEAARVMLGGLLATGRIRDADERRFLEQRLRDLDVRVKSLKR